MTTWLTSLPVATQPRSSTKDSPSATELDTEDEEVHEEEEVTGEEEEEGNREGNEEDEPVSNDGMEHSVFVIASGHPRCIRL